MLKLLDDLQPLDLMDEAPLDLGLGQFQLEDPENTPGIMLPPGTIARVNFPTLMRLDTATPDKRMIRSSGFSHRDLPLPLAYKDKVTGPNTGHLDARICGTLTEAWVTSDHIGPKVSARGYLADLPAGREAHVGLKSKAIRGVSADLGSGSEQDEADEQFAAENGMRCVFTRAVMVQATLCPVPAFPDAYGELDDDELVASCQFVSEPGTIIRPAGWLNKPKFTGPTPVFVDGDHISGHIWCKKWPNHRSYDGPVTPPAFDDMVDFQGGAGGVWCDDGKFYSTGRVVLGGPHIKGARDGDELNEVYSATSRAVADVRAGYDEFGIWINGAIRPGTGPKTRYAATASAVSGHWYPSKRDHKKHLHLVLAVNGEGFGVFHEDPLADELVASGPPPEMADMTPADNSSEIDGDTPTKVTVSLRPDQPADLSLDGGEPPESLHITLKFLGDLAPWGPAQRVALTEAVGAVVDVLEQGPFDVSVGGFGALGPDGARVLFVEADGLDCFRDAVSAAVDLVGDQFGIDTDDTHDGFIPHMTLAYGGDVEALADRQGTSFTASTVRIAFGPDAVDVALSGGSDGADEPDDDGAMADRPPLVRRPLRMFESRPFVGRS